MDIADFKKIDSNSKKLVKKVNVFEKLLEELEKREMPSVVLDVINVEIERVNSFYDSEKMYSKILVKSQTNILKIIEKELDLFVKKHHQTRWMAIGAGLGVAFGSAFGASQDNMGLMALGIPLGVGFGIAIGKQKDDEVFKLGKQLDVETEV